MPDSLVTASAPPSLFPPRRHLRQTTSSSQTPAPWPPTTPSTMSSTAEAGTVSTSGRAFPWALANRGQSGRLPHRHARQPHYRAPHRAPARHEDPLELRQGRRRCALGEGQVALDIQGQLRRCNQWEACHTDVRLCRDISTPTASATTYGPSSSRTSTSSWTTRTKSTPIVSRLLVAMRSVLARPRAVLYHLSGVRDQPRLSRYLWHKWEFGIGCAFALAVCR